MFIRVCSWDQPVEGIRVEGSKTGQRMSQDTVPTSAPDSPWGSAEDWMPFRAVPHEGGGWALVPASHSAVAAMGKGWDEMLGRPFSVPEDCQPAVSQSLKGDGWCLSPSSHHMLVWLEKSDRKWAQRCPGARSWKERVWIGNV